MTETIQSVKAEFFKAMAHPARIRVLELLCDGELTVSELTNELGLEGSHVSQQLGVLRRANLVGIRKEGTTVIYSLADRRIAKVLQLAKEILLTYLTETAGLLSESGTMSLFGKIRRVGRVAEAPVPPTAGTVPEAATRFAGFVADPCGRCRVVQRLRARDRFGVRTAL